MNCLYYECKFNFDNNMRQKYTIKNITLVANNVNETGFDKYTVILDWTDKTGETREVKDIVMVNPKSIIYGKVSKPLQIAYPSSHTFIINNQKFSNLGDDVNMAIKVHVAKALLKFIYPVDGRQYISIIF